MKPFLLTLILTAMPAFLFGDDSLAIGADAPALTVPTHTGDTIDLAEIYAKGPVVVYFYPKADTPGCTAQACNIRDNYSALQAEGVTVLGVSSDDIEAQSDFQEKYELPFTLIADHKKDLGKAFSVGSFAGLAYKRQTFLIVDGKIAWKDLSASPKSQAQDVLEALKSLRDS